MVCRLTTSILNMMSIFRLTRAFRPSADIEFMIFTSRLAPPTSNGKLRGWWDGDYVESPREEVTLYDFGYPLSPTLTGKGKNSVDDCSREKSQ